MNENNINCYYHLQNLSNSTCEACGKPICDDCCEIEKKEEGKGNKKEIRRHIYCKPCYYDNEIARVRSSPRHLIRKILKFIVFPAIILITLFFIFFGFNPLFYPSPEFLIWKLWMAFLLVFIESVLIFGMIHAKLNTPREIKYINVEKSRFFSDINTLKKRYHDMQDDLFYKCPYCQAQIEENSSICKFCGMELEKTI